MILIQRHQLACILFNNKRTYLYIKLQLYDHWDIEQDGWLPPHRYLTYVDTRLKLATYLLHWYCRQRLNTHLQSINLINTTVQIPRSHMQTLNFHISLSTMGNWDSAERQIQSIVFLKSCMQAALRAVLKLKWQ